MPTYNEVCDGIETLLADPDFSAEIQRRVARATANVIGQIFNAGDHSNKRLQERYADVLGAALEGIWRALTLPPSTIVDTRSHSRESDFGKVHDTDGKPFFPFRSLLMTKAILYVNSLGIRWKVLESETPEHYNFRVAVYLSGFDKKQRQHESKYNRRIFASGSPHLLYLLCRGQKPQRLVLALEIAKEILPDGIGHLSRFPFEIIFLPPLSSEKAKELKNLSPPKDGDQTADDDTHVLDRFPVDELNSLFSSEQFKTVKGQLENVPIMFPQTERGECPPASYYNLYRLFQSKRGKAPGAEAAFFAYLPDPALSSLEPAGFAGSVVVDGAPRPTALEFGRFLHLLQTFFSQYFAHPVAICEAETIQVALEKGIRSEQTWRGMFLPSEANAGTPPPLLTDLRRRTLRRGNPSRETSDVFLWQSNTRFNIKFNRVCAIVQEHFVSKVDPIPLPSLPTTPPGVSVMAPFEATEDDPQQERDYLPAQREAFLGGFTPSPKGASLRELAAAPLFGYHALAKQAYETIRRLWENARIVAEKPAGPKSDRKFDLLTRVNELLFFEPALHYTELYRDHFLHSFNLLLLGYWFLGLKKDSRFGLFPDIGDRSRLLDLWTITATVHDFAYPLQKLEAGAADLFKRYSAGGKESFTARVSHQWWDPICQPYAFKFLHEIIRRISGDSLDPKSRGPRALFKDPGTGLPVESHELAAGLLSNLLKRGDHGVCGALLLHNHFLEHKDENGEAYGLNSSEWEAICAAVAVHHIEDYVYPRPDKGKVETDSTKEKNWQLVLDNTRSNEVAHRLAALLLLCDTLCQWGRTRISRDFELEDTDKIEERKIEARLAALTSEKMVIYYPNIKQQAIEKIVSYYRKPFQILDRLHSTIGLDVRIVGNEGGVKAPRNRELPV